MLELQPSREGYNFNTMISEIEFVAQIHLYIHVHTLRGSYERWGAGVETQKNVRAEVDVHTLRGSYQVERWGAGVEYHFQEFNEPYAPS